jgi:hypothetical protein
MFNFSIEYSDLIWGDKFNCIPNTKFLKIDDAYDFIKNNHSSKNIITHNGDIAVDEKFNSYINKFPKWYGQNIVTASPKFSPIPIGLENDYVFNSIDKKNMLVRFSNERSSVMPSKMFYVNHNQSLVALHALLYLLIISFLRLLQLDLLIDNLV